MRKPSLLSVALLGAGAFVANSMYNLALAGNYGDDALDKAREIHNLFHTDDPLPTRGNPNPTRKAKAAPDTKPVPAVTPPGSPLVARNYDFIPGVRYVTYDAAAQMYAVVWGGQVYSWRSSQADAEAVYNELIEGKRT